MRPPQKLEPLSIDELRALGNQLKDAADVCFNAIATLEAKGLPELQVLYKSSMVNGLSAVNRTRTSIYEAWRMLEMGLTVKVSPRSVTRKKIAKKAASIVNEEEKNLAKARDIAKSRKKK